MFIRLLKILKEKATITKYYTKVASVKFCNMLTSKRKESDQPLCIREKRKGDIDGK